MKVEIFWFKGNFDNGKFEIKETHTIVMPSNSDLDDYDIEDEMWQHLVDGFYVQLKLIDESV